MRLLLIMAAIILPSLITVQAEAKSFHSHHSNHRTHHRHHKGHHHRHHKYHFGIKAPFHNFVARNVEHGKLVTVQTAVGSITVANHLSTRFKALISDFIAHGYRPRHVGCFASGGHVPNSRHYAGAACDFDQTGWGKTASFMYGSDAHALIVKHGFRDGCSFSDCGHVDDGLPLHSHRARYASRLDDDN